MSNRLIVFGFVTLATVGTGVVHAEPNFLWKQPLHDARAISIGSGHVIVAGARLQDAAPSSPNIVTSFNTAGNFEWSRSIGEPADLATIFTVAQHSDGTVFSGGPGIESAHVGRHDAAGNLQWLRAFGSASGGEYDEIRSIAADNQSNLFVTGRTNGDLAAPNSGGSDSFIRKYDAVGNQLWTKQFGGNQVDQGDDVAVDSQGNAYIAGYARASGPNQYDRTFLTKFDPNGNVLWSFHDQQGSEQSVAIDSQDNAYFVHSVRESQFAQSDVTVVKLNAAGNQIWRRTLSTPQFDDPTEVAIDGNGDIFIAGRTGGLLGNQQFGNDDAFIAKYNALGSLQWIDQFGTPNWDIISSIAADAQGNIAISGYTAGQLPQPRSLGFESPIPGSAYVGLFRGEPIPEPAGWILAIMAITALQMQRSR